MNTIKLAEMVLRGEGGPYQLVAVQLAKRVLELEKASPGDVKRNSDNKNDAQVSDLKLHGARRSNCWA